MAGDETKPAVGHLTVEDRRRGRTWVALVRYGDGQRAHRVLGLAWVKPNGKTARGAQKWRAADGTKPGLDHLSRSGPG